MSFTETDFELVEKFNSGSEKAFNEIVKRHRQKIYWHARRMTANHLDADEIVQEVLLVLYKKLGGFKFKSSLYTWIYSITATRSINFIKRRKLKEIFSFEDQPDAALKNDDDIIESIEQREKLLRLEKVLQKLPVKQREVFIMRMYDALSYEEISRITGKSVGGLKANYFHAIKKITELMKENE